MTSESHPRFSFIVTVFNGDAFLEETLLSFLHQTESDWEAVIVDDGSTDRTASILDRYQALDARFQVFHDTRLGRIPALNKAIGLANGAYIVINDADDISVPNRLRIQYGYLEEHPDVGMVGAFANMIDPEGNDLHEIISAPTEDKDIRCVLIRFNPFVHSTIMYRADVLRAAGNYRETFLPGFEWEMCVNIMKISHVANISQTLVAYRVHANSLTRTRNVLKRLVNVTRARWFVFREMRYPFKDFPLVFMGFTDVLPKSFVQWLRTLR
ncbi:MAG: glycosyltransferase [Candidatus Uhrbacteria bacterium]|nr:glycosyltransferase [Candidatus Uhrbacteria bacterium]